MPEEIETYDNADIDVQIFINNSMGVSTKDLVFELSFDPSKLTGIKAATTALSKEFFIKSKIDPEKGVWTLSSLEGEMAPGSGVLFTLRFAVEPGALGETEISLGKATLFSVGGQELTVSALPISTRVSVIARDVPPEDEATEPVKVMPWKNGNCNNDHVLDWTDYEAGKRIILKYDGVLASKGNGIDHQIYRSVQEALGLSKKDVLFMDKHLPLFRQYIAEHCGEGKEKKQ